MAVVAEFEPLKRLHVPAKELNFKSIAEDKEVTLLKPCGHLVGCGTSNPSEWSEEAAAPLQDAKSHGLEDALEVQGDGDDDTSST